jgi:hypothetical protein
VDVNLTTEGKTKLELGITLAFSYQVSLQGWITEGGVSPLCYTGAGLADCYTGAGVAVQAHYYTGAGVAVQAHCYTGAGLAV